MKFNNISLFTLLLMIVALGACKDKQADNKVVAQETNQMDKSIEAQKSTKKTILCFGNSLTAGYQLDEKDAWPSLLQNRIDSLELGYSVVNAGLSGETTAGGLGRIDWVLRNKVDIFILELGANDMLRGLDVTETEKNLVQIIEKVKTENPEVKIVTAGMLSPKNMGVTYEKAFNNIFPSLAKQFDGKNIPFFLDKVAGIDSLNLPDGKHPNTLGQKIVLENVWEVIEGVL